MSVKGGYKYIDFTGCIFTKDAATSTETSNVYKATKAGVYDSVEATYGKCLRIGGLVLNGQDIDEQNVNRTVSDGGAITVPLFVQSSALLTELTPAEKTFQSAIISIANTDEITITVTGA